MSIKGLRCEYDRLQKPGFLKLLISTLAVVGLVLATVIAISLTDAIFSEIIRILIG